MITVPEAVEKIVKRSRYLSEAMSKDIINVSSLARYMKPEIEAILVKKVSTSAVIMSLKRMSGTMLPQTPYDQIIGVHPEITVKTNLALCISYQGHKEIEESILTSTSPSGTILLGNKAKISEIVEENAQWYYPVSSISILLPKEAIETAGIYYFFIKSLAWERINILHMFTTPYEVVLVMHDRDTERALGILKALFEQTI